MLNGVLVIKAIKRIYPKIDGGFVYWSTRYDGTLWSHPSEGLIWENKKFSKPDWSKIENEIEAIKLEGLN